MLTHIFRTKDAATERKRRKSLMTGIIIAGLTLFNLAGVLPMGMVKEAKAVVTGNAEAFIQTPEKYVSQTVLNVYGMARTVNGETFSNFTLEWGSGASPSTWNTTNITKQGGGTSPVVSGLLGTWDVSTYTLGSTYTLRLTVRGVSSTAVTTQTVVIDSEMVKGFPKQFESVATNSYADWYNYSVPAAGDLDEDGKKEVVVAGQGGKLYAYKTDGSLMTGFPVTFTGAGGTEGFNGAPVLTDVNGDGDLEIVLATKDIDCFFNNCTWTLRIIDKNGASLTGWTNPSIKDHWLTDPNPTVYDIDGDGDKELIVIEPYDSTNGTGKFHMYQKNGTEMSGFPKTITYPTTGTGPNINSFVNTGSVSIADMTGDGTPEIAYAYQDRMYLYDNSGTLISGWPKVTQNYGYISNYDCTNWPDQCSMLMFYRSTPSFGDIDGDGALEVMAVADAAGCGGCYSQVYAYERNATLMSGFPFSTASSPNAVNDPYHKYGREGTSIGHMHTISLADIDNDGKDEMALATEGLNVYDYASGTVTLKFQENYTANSPISGYNFPSQTAPAISDYDGDGSFEFTSSFHRHVSLVEQDGTRSWTRQFDLYDSNEPWTLFQSPSILSDLDNDGKVELISTQTLNYGGTNPAQVGNLYIWRLPVASSCSTAQYQWEAYNFNAGRSGRMPVPTPPSATGNNCTSLSPSGDAMVKALNPTNNYGSRVDMNIDYNNASEEERSYMKFDLSSLAGKTIYSAKLKLYIANEADTGTQSLKLLADADANFNEGTITWNTKPTPTSTVIATMTTGTEASWETLDITSTVNSKKGGWMGFDIEQTGSDGITIYTKENTNQQLRPYLVVNHN